MYRRQIARAFLLGTTVLAVNGAPYSAMATDIVISTPVVTTQQLFDNDTITITNSGSLIAYPDGILIDDDLADRVTINSGGYLESSKSISVVNDGRLTGGIINDGEILGGRGITNAHYSIIDGVQNTGKISTASNAINNIRSTINRGIDNSGILAGGTNAIDNFFYSRINGGINNSGRIFSNGNAILNRDYSLINDGINNDGFITGNNNGILNYQSTINGGIKNKGVIRGSRGIVNTTHAIINGGIQNTGRIEADVYGIFNSGSTQINGGINNSGTISGQYGILSYSPMNAGITNSGTISGSSGIAIFFGSADDTLTLQTGSTLIGATDGGGGFDTLILQGEGSEDDAFFSFEKITMQGSEWTLSGDVSLLSGAEIELQSGILNLNGSVYAPSGLNLTGNGILGGDGTLTADLNVSNGSTLAPGSSIGVMNVVGDLNFLDGSIYGVEIDGTSSDLINVTGDVTISPNAILNVTPLLGSVDVYDQLILSASGSIDDTFKTITENGLIQSVKIKGGNKLLYSAFGSSSADISAQAGLRESILFADTLLSTSRDAKRANKGDYYIWSRAVHDFTEVGDGLNISDYDLESEGLISGADISVTDVLRMGLSLGFTNSDTEMNPRNGTAENKSLNLGLYGHYDASLFALSFGAHYGTRDKSLRRQVLLSGSPTNVFVKTDANAYGLYANASWTKELDPKWTLGANIGASYLGEKQDAYTDVTQTSFDEISRDIIRSGPSLDLTGNFNIKGVAIQPRASVGYMHYWDIGDGSYDVVLSGNQRATSELVDMGADVTTLGLGLDTHFENGLSAYLLFDGERGSDHLRNNFNIGIRYKL